MYPKTKQLALLDLYNFLLNIKNTIRNHGQFKSPKLYQSLTQMFPAVYQEYSIAYIQHRADPSTRQANTGQPEAQGARIAKAECVKNDSLAEQPPVYAQRVYTLFRDKLPPRGLSRRWIQDRGNPWQLTTRGSGPLKRRKALAHTCSDTRLGRMRYVREPKQRRGGEARNERGPRRDSFCGNCSRPDSHRNIDAAAARLSYPRDCEKT